MSDTRDLVVPELGESITEAIIGQWLKEIGQAVATDEPVVDLETDKITVQLPAPAAGVLTSKRFEEGATVAVGDVVGQISVGQSAVASSASTARSAETPASAGAGRDHSPPAKEASPAKVSATVAEPAAAVPASQPAPAADLQAVDEELLHRLTPAQRRAVRKGEPVSVSGAKAPAGPAMRAGPPGRASHSPAPDMTRPDQEAVRMSPLRKRIAERLVQVQQETASLTTFNEVDMSAVMALRSEHKQTFVDTHGVKLGFMSFFAKACVAACKLVPGINAEIRDDHIIYKKHYDFGIAVSTDRGLVVPVLRSVDRLSFAEIESGIVDLATRARTGKLGLDELTGGTFTITNGGIFGSMLSTPILNDPQTGILGMHNIVKRPVAMADNIEVRPIMYVALSYDHRVVDGREAVQFLVAVKQRIEDPQRLLLDL